jgi:hypothetical protein
LRTDIFDAIVKKANDDTLLQGLLKGTKRCFRYMRLSPEQLPAVTFKEQGETSKLQPCVEACYAAGNAIIRVNAPLLQVDVWVNSQSSTAPNTAEDADAIANRLCEIYLDARSFVTTESGKDTHGWQQVSSTQMLEPDTLIWHNALRFTFEYHVMAADLR